MFAIFDWVWSFFEQLGLANKQAKLLFLGLDNAGKTTLLKMLRDDRVSVNVPTLHPHSEELIMGGINFKTFDLGGHETARRIWKDYFSQGVDGIIYLVDAADRSRFDESRAELANLLEQDELKHVPIMILGNKIDVPSAASEDELKNHLLPPNCQYISHDSRPIEVFMCSVVKRMGYDKAFQTLSQFLKDKPSS